MLGFIIFFLTDIFMTAIFMAVYGGRRRYHDGMLLCVHIPEYALHDSELTEFIEHYKKQIRLFYMSNIIIGGAISFLIFWYLSIFMMIWSLWLLQLMAGSLLLIYKANRILYEMKIRRGWGLGYEDDDIYWKNGFYANPKDDCFLVADRVCSSNLTMNMGKKSGRLTALTGIGVTVLLLVVLCVVFLITDFTPRTLSVSGHEVQISAPMYDIAFDTTEIASVELLDSIPEDHFRKTNGLSDNRQQVGSFRGNELGNCRLYLYRGYTPVLKIQLKDYTVYINSKDPDETQKWYQELTSS
ncbi:MAG: hypothetical protein PHW34_05780 [Hespellia sp.]|nr:hypothetical protein [Hespellia sp.]